MAKIKIKDLEKLEKIDEKELKKILGGIWKISPDLELSIFPKFEGSQIRFRTALPAEEGASKIKINL